MATVTYYGPSAGRTVRAMYSGTSDLPADDWRFVVPPIACSSRGYSWFGEQTDDALTGRPGPRTRGVGSATLCGGEALQPLRALFELCYGVIASAPPLSPTCRVGAPTIQALAPSIFQGCPSPNKTLILIRGMVAASIRRR